MKKRFWILTVLVLVVVAVPIGVSAQESETTKLIEYTVIANTANLREGAGTGFPVVGAASLNESLLVYDEIPETAGWLRVFRDDEEDAYIADFLVERSPMRFYPPSQEPIATVSGRGKGISDVYDFPAGVYRVDASVSDNSFILHSVVVAGDCRDSTIFNQLDFDSNRLDISSLLLSSGCSIIFETDNVSGNWEFEIRDLLDADALEQSLLMIDSGTSISGKGKALTMATSLPSGIWTVEGLVDDQAFILHANVLIGDCDDTSVFNELDFDTEQLDISTVYKSSGDGCVIFWETDNVEGSWNLAFNKLK